MLRVRVLSACGPGLALLCAACAPAEPAPMRDCSVTIWAKATASTPRVIGSFSGWMLPGVAMEPHGEDDWHGVTLALPPGEHGYLVADDDGIHPDPYNPQRTYRGEEEVSLALVPECSAPAVTIDSVLASDDGTITLAGTFLRAPAEDGSAPLLASARAVLEPASAQGSEAAQGVIESIETSPETGTFVLRGSGFPRGKHTFRVEAEDAAGALAEAPAAVAWVRPAAPRWSEGLVYQ